MMLKDVEEVKPNLFVKKTKTGYRQVFPIHKDITKPLSLDNIHWKRALIGNPDNAIAIAIMICIVLFSVWAYNHDMAECNKVIGDENFMVLWNDYHKINKFVGGINLSNITWKVSG